MISNDYEKLEESLGYVFKDKRLLMEAITHKTFSYESQDPCIVDNQRLEFLGDSVLGMITAEYLFSKHPDFLEGQLTKGRSLVINNKQLAKKALELDISQYLLLGKGEEKTKGRKTSSNHACVLEAVIGAIYLDGGLASCRVFVENKII